MVNLIFALLEGALDALNPRELIRNFTRVMCTKKALNRTFDLLFLSLLLL